MIGVVVDKVMKEAEKAANEGSNADCDYRDAETGLLVCGKCHTEKQKKISFLGETLETLKDPHDVEHARIYDRIMERCMPIFFGGRNYRTEKGRANRENALGVLRRETPEMKQMFSP